MTPITTFAGRTVAVFGLGRSGLATCRALAAGGAAVVAADDSAESCTAAAAAGFRVEDLKGADWSRLAALVLAPGVPLTHPEPHWSVVKARAAGVEIIGDIELFCRERAKSCPAAPFVAITGTNGKSTTTALIAHILRQAGRDVQMGGNIGTAILDLEPPAPGRVHVIEMSSFQIELTPSLRPSVGVLLNISPDHLDRHGTMEHYAALKARLVEAADRVVIGEDDDWCRDIAERLRLAERGWVDLVSAKSRVSHGWYANGTELVARAPWTGPLGAFADLAGIGSLRGRHNMQNALAASAAALILGVCAGDVAAALATFPGLPHRLEEIGRCGRALFINDSKAPNGDSTATALAAFRGDIAGRRRLRTLRHARGCRRRRGARCGGEQCSRARSAAVPRLRLLRPVPQLRGARRRLPRPRGGAAGCRAAQGGEMTPDSTRFPSPLVGEGRGGGDRSTSDVGLPPTPSPSPQGGGEPLPWGEGICAGAPL